MRIDVRRSIGVTVPVPWMDGDGLAQSRLNRAKTSQNTDGHQCIHELNYMEINMVNKYFIVFMYNIASWSAWDQV